MAGPEGEVPMPLNTTIVTHSGAKVDLTAPIIRVPIEDIAHALAYRPRFNCQLACSIDRVGWVPLPQVTGFYTVAHHSLLVAGMRPTEWKLEALLHDAHEALIGDIPTPAKRAMQAFGVDFSGFERSVQLAMREGLGLPPVPSPEAEAAVRAADHAALLQEIPIVFPKCAHESWRELGYDSDSDSSIGYPFALPEEIKRRFLSLYSHLTEAANCGSG